MIPPPSAHNRRMWTDRGNHAAQVKWIGFFNRRREANNRKPKAEKTATCPALRVPQWVPLSLPKGEGYPRSFHKEQENANAKRPRGENGSACKRLPATPLHLNSCKMYVKDNFTSCSDLAQPAQKSSSTALARRSAERAPDAV